MHFVVYISDVLKRGTVTLRKKTENVDTTHAVYVMKYKRSYHLNIYRTYWSSKSLRIFHETTNGFGFTRDSLLLKAERLLSNQ